MAVKSGLANSAVNTATYNRITPETVPSGESSSVVLGQRNVSYDLDSAGNRQTVGANGSWYGYTGHTSLNQYGTAEGQTVSNGSQHEISGYNGVAYTYLADTRLSRATSSAPGAGTYELGYDAFGRTVRRTMNGQTTFAAYDGARAILEYNGSGAVTASTLYGLGVDEVIQRNNNGTQQFFFQDRLGNTRALTSAAGEVIEQYRYDAFGAPSFYTGPTATSLAGAAISGNTTMQNNRILFTGREWVAGFGFYEYRARAYNPTLGRFMSEDPIGFAAGDANLFRYCGGDPVNCTDPSGLKTKDSNPPTQTDGLETPTGRGAVGQTQEIVVNGAGIAGLAGFGSHSFGDWQPFSGLDGFLMGGGGSGGGAGAGFSITTGVQQQPFFGTAISPESNPGVASPAVATETPLSHAAETAGMIGNAASATQYAIAGPGYWLAANGKYYPMSWGGNQWTGPRAGALADSRAAGAIGKVAFGAGVLVSGYNIYNNPTGGVVAKESLNTAVGVIGIYGGPWGAGAAGLYFAVDMSIGWDAVGRAYVNGGPYEMGL